MSDERLAREVEGAFLPPKTHLCHWPHDVTWCGLHLRQDYVLQITDRVEDVTCNRCLGAWHDHRKRFVGNRALRRRLKKEGRRQPQAGDLHIGFDRGSVGGNQVSRVSIDEAPATFLKKRR